MNKRKTFPVIAAFFSVTVLGGCGASAQTDDLTIAIPEYEKITYTSETVTRGDIEPELTLHLTANVSEKKEYYVDNNDMTVREVCVKVGDHVEDGDVMITFASEEIEEQKRQYESRAEEDGLLIEHYEKLDAINQTDEHAEDIASLKKDQEIAQLYVQEFAAQLDMYTIRAEGSGMVTALSGNLEYGYVYTWDPVVTVQYGDNEFVATTTDDYDFQIGETYVATHGVASYNMVLVRIETADGTTQQTATGTDAAEEDTQMASGTDADVQMTNDADAESTSRTLVFSLADADASLPSGNSLDMVIQKPVLADVLYVPKDSVFHVGGADGADYVYVLDENGFRHGQEVTVGTTVGDYTVIESGLEEGEKVVTGT